jgi:hypothetical protein
MVLPSVIVRGSRDPEHVAEYLTCARDAADLLSDCLRLSQS